MSAGNKTRFSNWINSTLTPINVDLEKDLSNVVTRCRDLAKNNNIVRAYLSMCVKNIIGKAGLVLQSQLVDSEDLNDAIEWAWYDFGKTSNGFLTVDGHLGNNELDALILRTLLTDGEVFIRIHRNAKNPYGISFQVLDSMNIDYTRRSEFGANDRAIILGVEIDKNYRETGYYIRQGNVHCYSAGEIEYVKASDIIHLYKHEFPNQTRGIPPFNAILADVKQLEDFRVAELMAAKTSACMSIFYERNSSVNSGDFLDQANGANEDKGTFINELTPGAATITPEGYNVKSVTPTHPNSNFDSFNKAILKQIASSLGCSYNKLVKDYESASFSSLKEASIDESAFFAEQQQFLIDNWKEIEFKLWLESYVLMQNSVIRPTMLKEVLKNHSWICQRRAFVDASKEIIAEKYACELGVKSPIEIITEQGKDVDDVLRSYKKFDDLCKKYGVSFKKDEKEAVLESIENKTEEEIISTERK